MSFTNSSPSTVFHHSISYRGFFQVRFDYDGSQIPAEWHGWMHYNTDIPPTVRPPVKYKWMAKHTENFTGTDRAYVPYDTVPQKIQAWVPGKK